MNKTGGTISLILALIAVLAGARLLATDNSTRGLVGMDPVAVVSPTTTVSPTISPSPTTLADGSIPGPPAKWETVTVTLKPVVAGGQVLLARGGGGLTEMLPGGVEVWKDNRGLWRRDDNFGEFEAWTVNTQWCVKSRERFAGKIYFKRDGAEYRNVAFETVENLGDCWCTQ